MKLLGWNIVWVFAFVLFMSSCSVIGGIFKAGFWTGIILVALVIGIVIYLFTRRSNP